MANYGSDTEAITDMPLISRQITDPVQVVGQRVARRLLTPRGALALIGDDPNGGFDVRQYLNGRVGPANRAAIAQQIEAECLKDEAVSGADVDVAYSAATGVLAITIKLTGAAGPFQLVLNVTAVSASVLFGAA